jgi:hypothetical protein
VNTVFWGEKGCILREATGRLFPGNVAIYSEGEDAHRQLKFHSGQLKLGSSNLSVTAPPRQLRLRQFVPVTFPLKSFSLNPLN